MGDRSHIEWTDATWNPIAGCAVVSPGCTHCYAMRQAGTRLAHLPLYSGLTAPSKAGPVWTGAMRLNEPAITRPLHWRRPRRIFVNSMSDLFAEGVPYEWIDRVFAVMAAAHWHTFQILTKRPGRMAAYLARPEFGREVEIFSWPLDNVWLGVSVEDNARADERIPILLATPAAKRFISAEPLVGPVDLAWAVSQNLLEIAVGFIRRGHFSPGLELVRPLDWVIVGGESGPGARPMRSDWARQIRDACAAAGVPFFFKQWGEFGSDGERLGRRAAGRVLDGAEHLAWPA